MRLRQSWSCLSNRLREMQREVRLDGLVVNCGIDILDIEKNIH